MNTIKQTHDIKIFSGLVEILISSGLGKKDYGLNQYCFQTRYEELAEIMNKEGFRNRDGNPLSRNTLKQVIHRIKRKKDLLDDYKPNWDDFNDVNLFKFKETSNKEGGCLVCGVGVPRENHKTCSTECGNIYHQHKDAPCDPKFPSAFHQMKYEESFSKIN
jgi:predicted nucleic acid-binding Zn ribbon protein